jgi:preprotein translocase subunit SecD
MLQFQLWKKLLVVMVAVLGIIFALPNLIGGDDGAGADFLPGKQINLGLDLQGGSHLLLRVDVDAVKQERLENIGETLRRDFRAEKIRFSGLAVANETGLHCKFAIQKMPPRHSKSLPILAMNTRSAMMG